MCSTPPLPLSILPATGLCCQPAAPRSTGPCLQDAGSRELPGRGAFPQRFAPPSPLTEEVLAELNPPRHATLPPHSCSLHPFLLSSPLRSPRLPPPSTPLLHRCLPPPSLCSPLSPLFPLVSLSPPFSSPSRSLPSLSPSSHALSLILSFPFSCCCSCAWRPLVARIHPPAAATPLHLPPPASEPPSPADGQGTGVR